MVMIDVSKIRKDFPILGRKINGKPLVYFDNAATSQKPRGVIEAISEYYRTSNANVHRGIHTLSQEATEKFEEVRKKVAKFVGARSEKEIVFVRNATEAINLIAYSWGRLNISKGDEIVLTVMEHHSNFVPWQQLAQENGAVLNIVPIDKEGKLDLESFKKALTKKTKLVTIAHVSNVLGTINPIQQMANGVRRIAPQARVLVDGAQAVPHMPVNVSELDCDFYVFTGHKMLGPTGIGVLWAREELLEALPPFIFGGEMIREVDFGKTTFADIPWKFEAGTPDIAGVIGLGAAIDYLEKIGMENIREHERKLTQYVLNRLSEENLVTIYGSNNVHPRGGHGRSGVISFNLGDPSAGSGQVHAHDLADILDSEGVAIRSGHHCAQPLMKVLGISSAARISFYLYNTEEEVDRFMEALEKAKKIFKLGSTVHSLQSTAVVGSQ